MKRIHAMPPFFPPLAFCLPKRMRCAFFCAAYAHKRLPSRHPLSKWHPLAGLFLAACCLLFALAACSPSVPARALPPGTPVLAFGDSVTYGVGAGAGEDWPSLLAQKTGWAIENAGISGDTALHAKSRLPQALLRTKPRLVLLELGGNDFLRRRPQAEAKEDLRTMIRAIKASGAQAVLSAVPGFSLWAAASQHASVAPIYAELAKEEKVPLIAHVFSDTLNDKSLRADPIHPNARGYAKMADGIWLALKKEGFAR
jgi:acyl-CoA hydrolase